MRISDFFERGAAVKGLCETFLSGAPIHAILLTGPAGVGKRTLASLLSQSLFCTEDGLKPCGQCAACRRYLAGSHPDAFRIEEKKSIGVDEARALTSGLQVAAYEGGWKTVEIICAGAMTVQAQNSLLKTLEEPPAKTVFLLTAVSVSQLLSTILSRCRIVRVPPLSSERVEAILRDIGIDAKRAARLADMAEGSAGQALTMHTDDTFWQLYDRIDKAMECVCDSSDVLGAVNALKEDRLAAARACDILEHTLRSALRRLLTRQGAPESGWQEQLSAAGARSLTRLLEQMREFRKMLASNVPWQSALERFVLVYAEERKQWQS